MRRNTFGHRSVFIVAAIFALANFLQSQWLLPSHQFNKEGIVKRLDNFQKSGKEDRARRTSPLDFRYVGVAGLGHRLIRMSSAYHLASALRVPSMDVVWRGYCPKQARSMPNIFHLLFGNEPFAISSSNSALADAIFPFVNHGSASSLLDYVHSAPNSTKNNQLKLINEVEGYTHMYEAEDIKGLKPPFYGKIATDFEFYSRLMDRYTHRTNVDQMLAPYANKHTIIGIHIRAGNGEVGDFEKFRQLGQGNLTGWMHNLTMLLEHDMLSNENLLIRGKPPVIFLATDTPSVVEYFRINLGQSTQILITPQEFPSQGEGVSYNRDHKNLTMCLDSWKSQMMDMVALSEYADILISGQYSSFTQSLPVSRILNDETKRRFFCDVDRLAMGLKCYDSTNGGMSSWLSPNDAQARYLGAMDKMDKSSFAGPQIFFPIQLTADTIRDMIGGKRKGRPRRQA